MGRKAVFVDRDGTLIEEVDFLSRVDEMRIFPFTSEALDLFKENGFVVIVISNQSGVGRGMFDETAVRGIHEAMQMRLDGKLDGLYFCPHLPDAGCECRKPRLGMLNEAIADLGLDLSGSWIVGDKDLDIETGFNAGIQTAMVMTGYGKEHAARLTRKPTVVADNLLEAAKAIIANVNGRLPE